MAVVSIIIPVYNVDEYIDRCLYSIINQTFTDIEIILINDGSTDKSGEKCLEWSSKDNRVIYVKKRNEGAGPSRNLGIKTASSDLVAFCDPDDWYDERYIELMLNKHYETDADIVVCGYFKYDEMRCEVKSVYIPEYTEARTRFWTWLLPSAVWCKLYRRILFIENRIEMPAFYGQDAAIHCFIMSKAKTIGIIEKPLYYYLEGRPNSAMTNYIRHTSHTVQFLTYSWDLFIRDRVFFNHTTELFLVAVQHINSWYHKIKHDNKYTEKWLSECSRALRTYFGDLFRVLDSKICIIGSYSLFNEVYVKEYASTRLAHEYCFSGLLSYMSVIPASPHAAENHFRQLALDRDFNKSLHLDIINNDFSVVLIDFLDERFDLIEINGALYTKSDALVEAQLTCSYKTIHRWDSSTISLWEHKCLEFIDLIKAHFSPDRVILVKNYLTERYGTFDNQTEYLNIKEIKYTNQMLSNCYSFFEQSFPKTHVIEISTPELLYTSKHFRHGQKPWHYNDGYYTEVRVRIIELLLMLT